MHLGVYIFDTHLFVVLKGSHKETHFLEVFDLQASQTGGPNWFRQKIGPSKFREPFLPRSKKGVVVSLQGCLLRGSITPIWC